MSMQWSFVVRGKEGAAPKSRPVLTAHCQRVSVFGFSIFVTRKALQKRKSCQRMFSRLHLTASRALASAFDQRHPDFLYRFKIPEREECACPECPSSRSAPPRSCRSLGDRSEAPGYRHGTSRSARSPHEDGPLQSESTPHTESSEDSPESRLLCGNTMK